MSVRRHSSAVRALAVALLAAAPAVQALDLGSLGQANDSVQRTSSTISTGQQAVDTGRSVASDVNSLGGRNQSQSQPQASRPASGGSASGQNGQVSQFSQGGQGNPEGSRRLTAVLGDAWMDSARRGQVVVALLDQGPYLVERQAAYVASPRAQWLVTPRGDSTSVAIDLPADPEGTTFDLATGRVRPGGNGVRVFALAVYADLPLRQGRHSLDAIEQHAMLRASSMRMEWPRQSGNILEPTGGKLLVWASDANQHFPSGFGADGRLFTSDDPMTTLPRGYSVVTLDPQGFRFDRAAEIALTFYPVQPSLDIDLSRLGAGDATQALIGLIAERDPLAATSGFDATRLGPEFSQRVQAAAEHGDTTGEAQALVEMGQRLKDGQYRVLLPSGQAWPVRADRGLSPQMLTRGSVRLPMPRTWLREDGKIAITGVAPGSTAALAGLQAGDDILSIEDERPTRYLDHAAAASFGVNTEARRADLLPLNLPTPATLNLRVGPGPNLASGRREQSISLGSAPAATTAPPPSEPTLAAFVLHSAQGANYAYIALDSFADGALGQLDRWERAMDAATQARVAGLVIDLRSYRGDDAYQLLPHMLASFYTRDKPLLMQDAAQRMFDPAARVWRSRGGLGLPAKLPLAASGMPFTAPVAVLTDSGCSGPCELFAWWLQHSRRADIVSTAPTAGITGPTTRVHLPGGFVVQVPLQAEIGPGGTTTPSKGVAPNLRVPIDAAFTASVQAGGDPLLDAAVLQLAKGGTTKADPHKSGKFSVEHGDVLTNQEVFRN